MRKSLIMVLLLVLVFSFATPAMAGDVIPPEKAFDEKFLTKEFTYNGNKYPDIALVLQTSDGIVVKYFSDYLRILPRNYDLEVDEQYESVLWRFFDYHTGYSYSYPHIEIISVNGIPWQLSEYAGTIIEIARINLKPGDFLYDEEGAGWKWFMNPKYNGTGGVRFQGETPFAPGDAKDLVSQYNPLNNGKPVKITKTDEPAPPENVVVENPGANLKNCAILTLGQTAVTIVKDGSTKVNTLAVAPEAPNGYTLIPLRGVIDEFGYELTYDGQKNTVTVSGQNHNIVMTISTASALVDGQSATLEQPPVLKNGRTLVPLRFVVENLGFQVDFDNGKITISK